MTVPTFFADPAEFSAWLAQHHAVEDELWVGYYKKATGRPSMTWPESVEAALCYGWIDGLRKSVDEDAYRIRFTPRRPGSIWSAVNVRTFARLVEEGRMRPAGHAIWDARNPERTDRYSFEQEKAALSPAQMKLFRSNAQAWTFWTSQPPSYRKQATWWVISAKREETRSRRLATLIADSGAGLRIKELRRRLKT